MIHKGAIALGLLVGAGIGVLLAPEKGKITRDSLKKEGEKLKTNVVNDYNEVKDDIKKASQSGKEKFTEEFKDLKVKASKNAEKALTFLEKQIATLKEKNKHYHAG